MGPERKSCARGDAMSRGSCIAAYPAPPLPLHHYPQHIAAADARTDSAPAQLAVHPIARPHHITPYQRTAAQHPSQSTGPTRAHHVPVLGSISAPCRDDTRLTAPSCGLASCCGSNEECLCIYYDSERAIKLDGARQPTGVGSGAPRTIGGRRQWLLRCTQPAAPFRHHGWSQSQAWSGLRPPCFTGLHQGDGNYKLGIGGAPRAPPSLVLCAPRAPRGLGARFCFDASLRGTDPTGKGKDSRGPAQRAERRRRWPSAAARLGLGTCRPLEQSAAPPAPSMDRSFRLACATGDPHASKHTHSSTTRHPGCQAACLLPARPPAPALQRCIPTSSTAAAQSTARTRPAAGRQNLGIAGRSITSRSHSSHSVQFPLA
ncbi:hypothetical protein DFH27DRAFT_190784 [Peziza echinospora]|nr:hypothetical protein DFH27DRAFT_190784 [Peziza echinospora]